MSIQPRRRRIVALSVAMAWGVMGLVSPWAHGDVPRVVIERVPDGGIQPQVAVDESGTVHLTYFVGDAGAGDVYYRHKQLGDEAFSERIRVNSQDRSVVATGTVRGARMALGRSGRVHVAWMGSGQAEPRVPLRDRETAPMLYARLNDAGMGFEPQRNLVQHGAGLDGGGTVAADDHGRVYVTWHGEGAEPGEPNRTVYVAVSEDDGRTFARERAALSQNLGVCHCCGIDSHVDATGALHILFRSATDGSQRGSWLLTSRDHAQNFRATELEPWLINACMLSTGTFARSRDRVGYAWETDGRISFAVADPGGEPVLGPYRYTGEAASKYPGLAINHRGEALLLWGRGARWRHGGTLECQLYDADGAPIGDRQRIGDNPTWNWPAAYARPDGTFVVLY